MMFAPIIMMIFGPILLGLLIIASGQLILMMREIAMNTRVNPSKEQYKASLVVAKVNNIVGWVIMVGGGLVTLIIILAALAGTA